MPGIVGLITKLPRETAEEQLHTMVAALEHESFYTASVWLDEHAGVYAGSVEREGSFASGMPLRSRSGDAVLLFSGEDFTGTTLASNPDGQQTSVSRASYLADLDMTDQSFAARLNGRFHGLIVHPGLRTAMLFNDRYGMQRLYYYESKDAFYFAAEAKAILAVCPQLRSIDERGLGEYIACGCVLENRSLFQDLQVLPPASAWTFGNGALKARGRYFKPEEWEEQPTLEPERYFQELRETFTSALGRYFHGDRIGMSLTGGLDTRAIMAWRKPAPGSLPCYTFGGMFRDCRDVVVARRVAEACGQSHQVIRVDSEFLARFPHYAERTVYLTDGCADVSHATDLYANEKVREIAPIRMTGNYGDEVLRWIHVFRPSNAAPALFDSAVERQIERAAGTYRQLAETHPLSFAAFRQAPWHHYGLLALEQTQVSIRSPFLDNNLVRTVFQAPQSAIADNGVRLRLIKEGDSGLAKIRTDLGFSQDPGSILGAIDQRLQWFTTRAEYAYDYGMPQWVCRMDHALAPLHLERLFLGRHKFYHFRFWYREFLAKYVKEILLDSRTLQRPYLQKGAIERIVAGHLQQGRNYTTEIHRVLTLELLHRCFIDANAPLLSARSYRTTAPGTLN